MFLSPVFVTRHFFPLKNECCQSARATKNDIFIPLNTIRRESFFCSLLSSKGEIIRVKHSIFRDEIYNWKDERDITQVLNCPISVNTFLLQKRTRQQPSSRRGKKNSVLFFKAVFFTSLRTHSVALLLVGILFEQIWRQLLRPPRDDSETFKTSVAGQSNWNAYEGSSDKELTPEEKKAKAKAEEDESNARRAAAAAKMQAEREKAGYKGSIF